MAQPTENQRDPWLLTPGPLTTSITVKQAMLHDWGSRDAGFVAINDRMRRRLVDLIGGGKDFTTVPMQGSGTFAVEAMLTSFVGPNDKLLILINGAYGKRMAKICEYARRSTVLLEWPEDQAVNPDRVRDALDCDKSITHVAIVHCETTSGILNSIVEVSKVVAEAGRKLLIDSMSAFGALPIDVQTVTFDAVAASSNKCIEGVPGLGFVLSRISALEKTKGNAVSLTLDLFEQWQNLEKTGQYRFTPPIHCIVAFDQALTEHEQEGGVAGRGGRYRNNHKILVDGMRALGFETLLPDRLQAPIIVTFHMPADPKFVFDTFYNSLKDRGFVIYPGKLTVADSFRIGCIGRLGETEMKAFLAAAKEVLQELGVASGRPHNKAAE
jgi:2-aminoethylphosphonate-pyruvate transaminase